MSVSKTNKATSGLGLWPDLSRLIPGIPASVSVQKFFKTDSRMPMNSRFFCSLAVSIRS